MYGIFTIYFLGIYIVSVLCTTANGTIFEGTDCDHLGTVLYEDLGCKPITKNGNDCPVKYECDLEEKNNTCLFGGQQFSINQQIPEYLNYRSCHTGCICKEGVPTAEQLEKIKNGESVVVGGQFVCPTLDCPDFGLPKNRGSCYKKYELDKCCATGLLCDKPENPVDRCRTPSSFVLEGQQINPFDRCIKCVCPKNFKGTFDERHCLRIKCAEQIHNQKQINDNCAPFYISNEKDPLCCPRTWICPTGNEKISTINSNADQTSDLRCKFGTTLLKLGEGFQSKATYWNRDMKAICQCILPPFVTCTRLDRIKPK